MYLAIPGLDGLEGMEVFVGTSSMSSSEHHSALLILPFSVDKGPSAAVSDDSGNQHNCSSQERREGGHVQ